MSRFVLTAQLNLQAPNNVAQVVRQIQSQLNGVSVNVQVQGAQQAQRQIQQIANQTNQAATAAERMGRAFAVSVRRFAAFSIATRAVGLFTSTLADAVQTSIDFERQLIKVSQVTGKSVGKLKDLTNEITRLSTGLGVSSNSLLEVSTILAQAGLSANDTKTALNALAKAALAPNFDSISETAEGAIAILAQFQEGVGALEKQLGSINAVAGAFAVEASDLIDVVRRTGGVFKSSGGSLNELLALFTSVRATTRESAESIGTGLRTIFTRIQRPKTIEFLKQFGVELVDIEGKFVGPYEAVRRLSEALSGLGERDITFIKIAEELGGFRQIGKVLPLLQQFATAEAALNVATKANNSLSQDAISAQAALAVRITKVKEEFLALVRSITETSTFQIMANTALALASALIKLADSIKPLLPLLGAMAAVKIAKGLSGFLGGAGSGLTSGRTFNKGGKVHHFARGGMVPGTGNRDTVPAMLSPGEFVIRKSSVNKLGASNLAAMNENRFALGGQARKFGVASLLPMDKPLEEAKATIPISDIRSFLSKKAGSKGIIKKGNLENVDNTIRGILGLKGQQGVKTSAIAETVSRQDVASKIEKRVELSIQKLIDNAASGLGKSLSIQVARKADNATVKSVGSASTIGSVFEGALSMLGAPMDTSKSEQDPIDFPNGLGPNFASAFQSLVGIPVDAKRTATKKILQDTASRKAASYLANAVYSDPRWQMLSRTSAQNFDPNKSYTLKQLGMTAGEAKNKGYRGVGGLYRLNTQNKNLGGIIQKFATGGGVGTDTVPALLTPGEFVVNRSSAQRIGYGNLNRMNKVGKYAKGGVVQRFAQGTSGTGVKPKGDIPFQEVVLKGVGKLERTLFKLDDVLLGSLGKLGLGLETLYTKIRGIATPADNLKTNMIFLDSVLPGLGKTLDENSKANKRSQVKNLSLVETISRYIQDLIDSGASQQQVRSAAQAYANALKQDTASRQKAPATVQPSPVSGGAMGIAGTSATTLPNGRRMPKTSSSSSVDQNTQNVDKNTAAQKNAAKTAMDVVNNNKMFAASMATSLIQGFLPAVDENSSAMLKMTHSLLGLVTTITSVGFALEAFGIKLGKGQIMDFLGGGFGKMGGKGIVAKAAGIQAGRGMLRAGDALSSAGMPAFGKLLTNLSTPVSKLVGGFTSLLGPIVAVAGSAWAATEAFKASIEAIYNFEGRLKSAIDAGNIDKAKSVAGERATFEGANVVRGGGATAGAIIGLVLGGPIGAAIGAGLGAAVGTATARVITTVFGETALDGLNQLFGGNTRDSAVALAAAQAGAVKTQKELDQAQKVATNAMEDFEKGSMSASEALSRIRASASGVAGQEKRASDFAMENLKNRAKDGYTGRNIASTLTFGMVESSSQRNQRLGQQSAEQIRQASKFQSQAFQMEAGARSATIRSGFIGKRNKEDIRQQAVGDLENRRQKLLLNASRADVGGDEESARAFREAADEITQQINQVDREMASLEKEVARAEAAFKATSLGLRPFASTSSAMSATMDRFMAGLEVGGDMFVANTEFLSQAVTSAAEAMDPKIIKDAISGVSDNLLAMGVNQTFVTKFEQNTAALVQAQQNYNSVIGKIAKEAKDQGRVLSVEDFKKQFSQEIIGSLGGDIGPEAKESLMAIINNIQLDNDEIAQIMNGRFEILGDKLGEAGQKLYEELKKIGEDRRKAEQTLINLTKQRIDSERNFVEAQREAVDLIMEGREIQGKYGGAAVTTAERRSSILAKANAGSARLGLSEMRNGGVGDLQRRRQELGVRFAAIEGRRSVSGGLTGATTQEKLTGVELDAAQQDLQKAYKDQIQTVRDLIKLEEDELKIIQEKNKLEKDSLESLISGDIEKFFEQQAAVGAQAALATGNQNLINQFGGKAVGMAFSDLQRQQEAGVQSVYGQRLAGPGGLLERSAGSALAMRGVQNPLMAQRLAGTTPEEEASKARLRELGGELGGLGELGANMAEMQVQTAQINVSNAQVQLSQIEERGKIAAEKFTNATANMYRGGPVYASRGIFVPKGTDTVPAMLTPGEFVVNRAAVNRGNNLSILQAINDGSSVAGGFSRGGKIGYYKNGGKVQYLSDGGQASGGGMSIDPNIISNFSNAINSFNEGLKKNIENLKNTKLNIQLDSTNVNVNLTGTTLLADLRKVVGNEILDIVSKEIQKYKVKEGGRLGKDSSVLG